MASELKKITDLSDGLNLLGWLSAKRDVGKVKT